MTELINAETLAERLHLKVRFIKEYSRASRTLDPLPHIRLHRKLRLYAWDSPEMLAWLQRRGIGHTRRKV